MPKLCKNKKRVRCCGRPKSPTNLFSFLKQTFSWDIGSNEPATTDQSQSRASSLNTSALRRLARKTRPSLLLVSLHQWMVKHHKAAEKRTPNTIQEKLQKAVQEQGEEEEEDAQSQHQPQSQPRPQVQRQTTALVGLTSPIIVLPEEYRFHRVIQGINLSCRHRHLLDPRPRPSDRLYHRQQLLPHGSPFLPHSHRTRRPGSSLSRSVRGRRRAGSSIKASRTLLSYYIKYLTVWARRGATGYILRESTIPDIKALSITVLVRKPDQAAVFEGLGIPAIVGTLDDAEVLRAAAAAHDVVLHTAGATHQASIAPLLAGLAERRHQAASEEEAAAAPSSSSSTHLIHTAGATMLSDYPITSRFRDDEDEGDSAAAAAARVFSDKHDDDIYEYLRRRQETDPYVVRTVALAAVDGGEAAGVGTCVVVPPRVYGRGTGLFNTRSQQIPLLIGGAVAGGGDKVAEYVGSGEGVWDDVHVVDLAALYEVLLGRILKTRTITNTDPAKGNSLPTGRRGIYFTATGIRHSWKEVAESIGQAGYQGGLLDSVEPRALTLSEAAGKYLGGNETYTELGLASNSLASADLAKDLGWVVTKTESDFQQGIVEEVESIKSGNVSQHNLAEVLANQAKAMK